MRVFVTGSSACLAQALLPRLCAEPGIERVTGVDRAAPRFAHPKFRAHRLDLRDPRLPELLAGHDALVHLAFVVLRGRMSAREMHEINVQAGLALFRAARRAGIGRLILMSSAAVYGSGVNVTEEAPFAPLPRFLYGQHKAELERLLEAEFPDCVRLRPHLILGRHAQPLLGRLLDLPLYPALPDPQPRLQCVHEEDVASAVLLALASEAAGPFNLAAEDSFSYRDVIRARHRASFAVPRVAARAGLELAWRLWGWGGEPAWIEGLAATLLLDCRRAHSVLGWRSTRRAAQMLAHNALRA
ncbi:MAG TPA: NAD-dependent epimerase/dehydratase family protein [Burkholderiales bacterium]|nr:NAD-dependent epimerase/dehydratase family protein [Burkholderiales bacterium]